MKENELIENITYAITKGGARGKTDQFGNQYGPKKKLYIVERSKGNLDFIILGSPLSADGKVKLDKLTGGDNSKCIEIIELRRYGKPSELKFFLEKKLEEMLERGNAGKNPKKPEPKQSSVAPVESKRTDEEMVDIDISLSTTDPVSQSKALSFKADFKAILKKHGLSNKMSGDFNINSNWK